MLGAYTLDKRMFGGVGGGGQHINVHVMLAVQQGCTALGGSQCAANLFYLSNLAVNDVVSMEKKSPYGPSYKASSSRG